MRLPSAADRSAAYSCQRQKCTPSNGVRATVIGVHDGDTLTVDAHPWPDLTVRTHVRLRGIDTPELNGKCAEERARAIAARDRLRALAVAGGDSVELRDVRPDKYGGRIDASVWKDGRDLAQILIAEGLGRAYAGGRREGWCG